MFRPPISRNNDGTFTIRLRSDHRSVLKMMVPQLRSLIEDRDQLAWRLFPNAYADDPLQALQFEELIGDDLKNKRLAALTTLENTIDESEVTEEHLLEWMTAVNDIRLVLGTRLGVDEDSSWEDYEDDDIDSQLFTAYSVFGFVLESIVEAL